MATKTSKKYWIKKFLYGFRGFVSSIKEERSMLIHIIIAILTIVFGGALKITKPIEWAIIILTIGMVIGSELLNTAIENIVDMISFKYNFNARKIKDVSAAATLFIAMIAIIVASLVFIPRIIEIAKNGY